MTLGMFSVLPLPKHFWDEDCAGLMMPYLPVAGVIIGAIWWGAAELLRYMQIVPALSAGLMTLVMFFMPGLIHLDGFMDTSDAVLSRRPVEEKIRILKDPHTGSFAVIMIAALFIMQFAAALVLFGEGWNGAFKLFIPITVISRCCTAFAALSLRPAGHSSYINMFRKNAKTAYSVFTVCFSVCAIAFAYYTGGVYGLIAAAAVALGYVVSMTCVYRSMNGVSGDLAGFSLVVSELCGVIALAAI